MVDPYDQFSATERERIKDFLPEGEKAGFRKSIWGYLFWILISILFGGVFLTNHEPTYAVAAYLSLLIPFFIGLFRLKRHFKLWAGIVRKFDGIIRSAK